MLNTSCIESISSMLLSMVTLFVISLCCEIELILITNVLIGFTRYLSNFANNAINIINENTIINIRKKLIIEDKDTFKSSIG